MTTAAFAAAALVLAAGSAVRPVRSRRALSLVTIAGAYAAAMVAAWQIAARFIQ